MKFIFAFFLTLSIANNSYAAFTEHFSSWLKKNYSFLLSDRPAYGGKLLPQEKTTKIPTILIHGNADMAVSSNFPARDEKLGWNNVILDLKSKGYKESELYAFTWGSGNPKHAKYNYHSYENLKNLRAFIQAVKKYTNSEKINVVAHSMGVTLARGAIIGGKGFDSAMTSTEYNLGAPLDFIHKFIGISGANLGLKNCYDNSFYPACGKINGLYPHGKYLRKINKSQVRLAKKIYSLCSLNDKVIGNQLQVSGLNTCFLPQQDGKMLFTKLKINHFETKTQTSFDILNFLI